MGVGYFDRPGPEIGYFYSKIGIEAIFLATL